jgi:hypothetical protein
LSKPVPEILLNLISQSITLGLCIYAVWRPRLGAEGLSSADQSRADLPAFAARYIFQLGLVERSLTGRC